MNKQDDLDELRKKTVMMLNASILHIQHSMTEGGNSVDSLIQSFTEIVKQVQDIKEVADELGCEDNIKSQEKIQSDCNEASGRMQSAIIAFQFYDKLSQRIDQVSQSLTRLAELVGEKEKYLDSNQWIDFQDNIRKSYTVVADRIALDAILEGASLSEALKIAYASEIEEEEEDDFELF